jgi:hypothetical protein
LPSELRSVQRCGELDREVVTRHQRRADHAGDSATRQSGVRCDDGLVTGPGSQEVADRAGRCSHLQPLPYGPVGGGELQYVHADITTSAGGAAK